MTPALKELLAFLHNLRPASISVDEGDTVVTAEFMWPDYELDTDTDPEGELAPTPVEIPQIRAVGGLRD